MQHISYGSLRRSERQEKVTQTLEGYFTVRDNLLRWYAIEGIPRTRGTQRRFTNTRRYVATRIEYTLGRR